MDQTRRAAVSFVVLWAFGGSLGPDFGLSAQEPDVFSGFAAVAGEAIQVEKDAHVTGDLHANGTVVVKKDSFVTGNVSATGEVFPEGTVTGVITPGAAPLVLPEIDLAALRGEADRLFESDTVFDEDVVVDDVVFVDGTVHFRGDVNGTGTIAATGDVRLDTTGGRMEQQGGGFVLEETTRLSLVAGLDVRLARDRPMRGVIRAGQDVQLETATVFEGVIVADRQVLVKKESSVTSLSLDEVAPEIAFTAPAASLIYNDSTPEISVSYSDPESGVDLTSLAITVDGLDVTGSCSVGAASATCEVGLAEGEHLAQAGVRDVAGNLATAARGFVLAVDQDPPVIHLDSPTEPTLPEDGPVAVAVRHDDAGVGTDLASFELRVDGQARTAACAILSASTTCRVSGLARGPHTLEVEVGDLLGNRGGTSFDFVLTPVDDEPPRLTITAPAGSLVLGDPTPAVTVEYADDDFGVDLATLSVLLDGADLTADCGVGPTRASCVPPELERGPHLVEAALADGAGNVAVVSHEFTLVLPLAISIDEPADGSTVSGADVAVAGTVDPSAVSVTVNGLDANLGGGSFLVSALPLHEGVNVFTAVAEDAEGDLGTAVAEVRVDTTAPAVSVDFPPDGFLATRSPLTVTGLVNDLAVGTVNGEQVAVRVNGVAAEVAHRGFAAPVDLVPGPNLLTVSAVDRAGNVAESSVTVDFRPPVGTEHLEVVSGDGQSGEISAPLPGPLLVEARDAAGQPVAGRQVVFRVTRGDGTLDGGERVLVRTTDGSGRARVDWTLGSRAGAGVNRVRAAVVGVDGAVVFSATTLAGPPRNVHVLSGDQQRGVVGRSVPRPLEVVVTDGGQNPVPGVPVHFRITRGGGTLNGTDTFEAVTDDRGMAEARLTLGPEEGLDNNVVEAAIDDSAQPVRFRASAFFEGDPEDTRISGVVLDNQGDPVPGYRLRAGAAEAVSDAGGRFVLTGVPVGHVLLDADGTTASRPGVWTSLQFELFTVAGVDNALERPVWVLPLDVAHGAFVDGSAEVTVTIPELPGFSLTVPEGSATFPDGSAEGLVSVTAVHADRIPMAPGAGMQPRVIVTIQPAGARFDPPARVTFPNVDALAPGTVTEMFSFDHGLGAFVSIGTGTVSEDGTVIRSDPGFGIVQAGWHCAASTTESGESGALQVDWLVFDPIVLCAGREPPDQLEVSALGTPREDAAWTLEVFDGGVVGMDPRGPAECAGDDPVRFCPGSRLCRVRLTAGEPGLTEILARLKCCPSGHLSEPDTAKVAVVKADLSIQGLAEENEPPPNEDYPGALIPFLDPAVAGAPDYQPVPMELSFEPRDLGKGEVTLSVSGPVKVWEDAGRTRRLQVPKSWDLGSGEQPPETVYLEGTWITGLGGVELKLDYAGCADTVKATVFGVDFAEVGICDDSVRSWLLPSALGSAHPGPFSMRVVDGNGARPSEVLAATERGAGVYTDGFNLDNLATLVEYRFLEARWEIDGFTSISRTPAHFMSFGQLRHTQYNIPDETDPTCASPEIDVCTRDPDPSQCMWRVDRMLRTFADQVASETSGTGTGLSAHLGLVKQDRFCRDNVPPPAECEGAFLFERDAADSVGVCGDRLGSDTLAVADFYRFGNAPCGSMICIRHNRMGIRKVVTDRCPGCGRDGMDNFSLSGECNILSFDDSATTLRLYD